MPRLPIIVDEPGPEDYRRAARGEAILADAQRRARLTQLLVEAVSDFTKDVEVAPPQSESAADLSPEPAASSSPSAADDIMASIVSGG